jgi:hypothetical protein
MVTPIPAVRQRVAASRRITPIAIPRRIDLAPATGARDAAREKLDLIPARVKKDSSVASLVMVGEGPPSMTLLLATREVVNADLRRHDDVGTTHASTFSRVGLTPAGRPS